MVTERVRICKGQKARIRVGIHRKCWSVKTSKSEIIIVLSCFILILNVNFVKDNLDVSGQLSRLFYFVVDKWNNSISSLLNFVRH